MDTIKGIGKICVYIIVFLLALTIIVKIVRATVYKDITDPIEQAVIQSLENEKLVAGSKLRDWIEALGEPDVIVKHNFDNLRGKGTDTELYWSNNGIGIRLNGDIKRLDFASKSKVSSILVPTRKILPQSYMTTKYSNRRIVNGSKSRIEFNHLITSTLNGKSIENIKVDDMDALYINYDASNHDYYNIPFPFILHSTMVMCEREGSTHYSTTCKEEVFLISLYNADPITLDFLIRLIAGIFIIPFYSIIYTLLMFVDLIFNTTYSNLV